MTTCERFRPYILDHYEHAKKRKCKARDCDHPAAYMGEYCHHCWSAKIFSGPGDQDSPDSVYFILAAGQDLVKIGVSNNIRKRFKSLQTMSPVDLVLAGVVSGGRMLEQFLHEILAEARVKGEWFDLKNENVLKVVESAASGTLQRALVEIPMRVPHKVEIPRMKRALKRTLRKNS